MLLVIFRYVAGLTPPSISKYMQCTVDSLMLAVALLLVGSRTQWVGPLWKVTINSRNTQDSPTNR